MGLGAPGGGRAGWGEPGGAAGLSRAKPEPSRSGEHGAGEGGLDWEDWESWCVPSVLGVGLKKVKGAVLGVTGVFLRGLGIQDETRGPYWAYWVVF